MKIIIEGVPKSGRSTAAMVIFQALSDAGASVNLTGETDSPYRLLKQAQTALKGKNISIEMREESHE